MPWHAAQLEAFSAANDDTIIPQIHMQAVPVLEGMCNDHAPLHPELA